MTEERSLVFLSEGARMLAEARTFDGYKEVRDVAIAAAAYAKAKRLGRDAQKYAVEIAAVASRRMAELDPAIPPEERRKGRDTSATADVSIPKQRRSENRDLLTITEEALREKVRAMPDPSLSRVLRVARDAKAKQRPKGEAPVLPPTCDIRLGDFRLVLDDVPDESIDLILTDPPYPAEYLPLWEDLAVFARRKLKPTGMLAAMSGQVHLPAIYTMLGSHMAYRWTMAYRMAGAANVVHARRVQTMWKPILVYGSTERRIADLVDSEVGEKAHHGWGQSESGMLALLKQLADPGAIVCDPFLGGGTTAVVALHYGCSFIGAEIDPEHHATAVLRAARAA